MILVYVCPRCNAVRIVSRRKSVSCLECGQQMALSDLSFLEWSEMNPKEREEYGRNWNQKTK